MKDNRMLSADDVLNMGADCYNRGEYKKAIEYYNKAAELGSVIALSNLGYCYYYGRSVPKDYEKAREYWEKASKFDDINSIYKLGDMYLNGKLAGGKDKAFEYYERAYELAGSTLEKDIYNYPDICFRMAKCYEDPDFKTNYNRTDMATRLLKEAVYYFKIRVEKYGDTHTDGVLKGAEEMLDKCNKESMN